MCFWCTLLVHGRTTKSGIDLSVIDLPIIEIVSPADGTTISSSADNDLKVHVKISGMSIPGEGYGDNFLNDQLIGSTPQNEVIYLFDASNSIPEGLHRLTVVLFDSNEVSIGVEKTSLFRFAGREISHEGDNDTVDMIDRNPIDMENRTERDDISGAGIAARTAPEPISDRNDKNRPGDIPSTEQSKARPSKARQTKPMEWSTSCVIDAVKTTVSGDSHGPRRFRPDAQSNTQSCGGGGGGGGGGGRGRRGFRRRRRARRVHHPSP